MARMVLPDPDPDLDEPVGDDDEETLTDIARAITDSHGEFEIPARAPVISLDDVRVNKADR